MTTAARLRPMSLTELLDQSIRLYRRHFLQFVGIIAIVQIPLTLLTLMMSLLTMTGVASQLQDPVATRTENPFELLEPTFWIGIGGSLILAVVSYLALNGIATGALSRAVADHYLGGSIDFVQAYLSLGGLWMRLVGALLLVSITTIGLAIWTLLVPCVGQVTGIGVLVFWAAAISPLIAPIIVLEKQTPRAAIRRAWDLTRRRFWWVLGYVAVLLLLNQVIIAGPTTLLNYAFQFLARDAIESGNLSGATMAQTITASIVSLIGSLIYLPLQLTGIVLMYFDLRIRTEGFDLALLTRGPAEGSDAAEAVTRVPLPKSTSLLTWKEVGYFLLLTVAAGMLFAILWGILAAIGLGVAGLMDAGSGF